MASNTNEEGDTTPFALDADGLADMVVMQRRRLLSFIMKRVRDSSDSEDIFQMACLEAFRGLKNFHGDSRPETWLFGIANRLVLNYFTRSPVFRYSFESIAESDGGDMYSAYGDPYDIVSRREVLEMVADVVEEMSPEMRKTAELVLFSESPYADAAEHLGVPVGTIRSRISRVRDGLKMLGEA